MSDLDSRDSVDAKNGLTHLDWTPDTRDTECVLKWVLVCIAAFCYARRPQILIPELVNISDQFFILTGLISVNK